MDERPTGLRVDHLVYAVPDLDAGIEQLHRRLGVRAVLGGRHLGLGTHNALLALGRRTYLEVIAPDPRQPDPPQPRPFGVDDVTHAALVGWALAADDIEAAVTAARDRGYDPGEVMDLQREGAAGVLHWRLTSNAMRGGLVPFLISCGGTPHPAASAPHGLVLDELRIEHPDPAQLRVALAALHVDVPIVQASAPALVAAIDGPKGHHLLR